MLKAIWPGIAQIASAPSGTATDGFTANFDIVRATVDRQLDGFLAMLPLFAVAIVVFVLLLFAARSIRYAAGKALARSSNRSAATAIGRLLYVAMLALAVLIAVTIAFPSMTPGRLIFVLGIGSVAIGFAFKDIFQNLLAGILILLRRPFEVGNEITITVLGPGTGLGVAKLLPGIVRCTSLRPKAVMSISPP